MCAHAARTYRVVYVSTLLHRKIPAGSTTLEPGSRQCSCGSAAPTMMRYTCSRTLISLESVPVRSVGARSRLRPWQLWTPPSLHPQLCSRSFRCFRRSLSLYFCFAALLSWSISRPFLFFYFFFFVFRENFSIYNVMEMIFILFSCHDSLSSFFPSCRYFFLSLTLIKQSSYVITDHDCDLGNFQHLHSLRLQTFILRSLLHFFLSSSICSIFRGNFFSLRDTFHR